MHRRGTIPGAPPARVPSPPWGRCGGQGRSPLSLKQVPPVCPAAGSQRIWGVPFPVMGGHRPNPPVLADAHPRHGQRVPPLTPLSLCATANGLSSAPGCCCGTWRTRTACWTGRRTRPCWAALKLTDIEPRSSNKPGVTAPTPNIHLALGSPGWESSGPPVLGVLGPSRWFRGAW